MNDKQTVVYVGLFALVIGVVFVGGAFLIPWSSIRWGNIAIAPAETITVTGTAKSEVKNQIAVFTAGINVVKDTKEAALEEANKQADSIIAAVKNFGIPASDIKTQNMNVFQQEETYYDNGVQRSRGGQWRVSNSVEIKLRDVDKASDLAKVLTDSGANNIYGPNFSLDDTDSLQTELLGKAIENARSKADLIAKSTGRKLENMLTVTEGYQSQPITYMYKGAGGGGGAPSELGTGTIEQTVTVTYELK